MGRHLRNVFFCLLPGFLLSGCLYYGDIHGKAKPLTPAQLSKSQAITQTANAESQSPWWHKFNNPQLNQLINMALSRSPAMGLAEARIRKAEFLSKGAYALRWPTLDFSGYLQRQRFANAGLTPPPFNGKTYNIATLGLTFNYEIDFWGKYQQAWLAKVNGQKALQASYAEAELILSSAVTSTYYLMLGQVELLKLAEENWKCSKERLEIALMREKSGIDSSIPVKTLEANVETAKQSVAAYQESVTRTKNQLAVLAGDNPQVFSIVAHPVPFHYQEIKLPAALPANLLANRPDIQAARWQAEAAANQINVAKSRFFPNINLNALFSYQGAGPGISSLFEPGSQNNALTGAIDLPIFDAGARRANLGVKYAEYDIVINQYNHTILNALQQTADEIARRHALQIKLRSAGIALLRINQQYKLIRKSYHAGIVDYAATLESKQLVLQQQANLQHLQTQHLLASVGLIKALGGKAN